MRDANAYWDALSPGDGEVNFSGFSLDKGPEYREMEADHPARTRYLELLTVAEACAQDGTGGCLTTINGFFRSLGACGTREAACRALGDALSRGPGGPQGGNLGQRWYTLWATFAAEAAPPEDEGALDYWQQLTDIYDGLRTADCSKLCGGAMPFMVKARKDKANGKQTLKRLGEIILETCQKYDASAPGGAPLDFWLLLGEAIRGEKRWAYCFNIFDKGDRMHTASIGVNAKVLTVPSSDVFQASALLQEEKYKNIQEAGWSYRRNGSRKEIISAWLKEMKFIPSN